MNVTILTPGQTVYEGTASSIKLPGTNGNFEVLEAHAPLVSSLVEGSIVVTTSENEVKTIKSLKTGFVEVFANEISVLLESVE